MVFARQLSTILFAGALCAPLLSVSRTAGAAPAAETKAERKAGRKSQNDRPGPAGAQRPAVMLERMKQQILSMDLTADQKKQIEDLFTKAQDELLAGRRQSAGDKDAAKFREKAQATLRDLRQKVGSLLTEDQRQSLRRKFQAAQDTAREEGVQIAERVKNALKSIDLTPEQKQKLDTLLAESQRKAKELTQRTQSQMRELMQETRAKVEALLTEEQRQKISGPRSAGRKPNSTQGEQPGPTKPNAPDDRL